MNATYLISGPWVERLGWTLLHFLWQGVLVLAIYMAVRRWVRTSSPNTRYLLACAALAILLVAPLTTFGLIGSSEVIEPNQLLARAPVSVPATGSGARVSALETLRSTSAGRENVLSVVVVLWLAGAMAFWIRLIGGWIVTVRLRTTQVRLAPPQWQQTLGKLGAQIGVSRRVQLLVSARVQVPMVIGWLRPVVLAPVGALSGLPTDQIEALLLHEMAHIRRHDYLVNILQGVAEALLFYHPAVWWISRDIRIEREFCCDDVAVSVSGDTVTYARALAELESLRPAHGAVTAANGGSLGLRIARLLGETSPATRALPGPSVIVSAMLLVIAVSTVFGQSTPPPRFDSASIRPSTWGPEMRGTGLARTSRGQLTMQGGLLRPLTSMAYGVSRYQVVGGPDWIDSARYDIEGKAEGASPDQLRLMLQALLAETFRLRVHRETRVVPGYLLTIAGGGLRVEEPREGSCFTPDPNNPRPLLPPPSSPDQPLIPRCGQFQASITPTGGRIDGGKASMEQLAAVLSNMLGRKVIDRTGYADLFDAHLVFAPDDSLAGLQDRPPSSDNPAGAASIIAAIQEQLGLRLEAGMTPVEVVVIDDAEKPTQN